TPPSLYRCIDYSHNPDIMTAQNPSMANVRRRQLTVRRYTPGPGLRSRNNPKVVKSERYRILRRLVSVQRRILVRMRAVQLTIHLARKMFNILWDICFVTILRPPFCGLIGIVNTPTLRECLIL